MTPALLRPDEEFTVNVSIMQGKSSVSLKVASTTQHSNSRPNPLICQLLGNSGGDLAGLGKVGLGAGSVA